MKFLKTTALALALAFSAGHAVVDQVEVETRFKKVLEGGFAQRPALAKQLFEVERSIVAPGTIEGIFGKVNTANTKRAFRSITFTEFASKIGLDGTAPTMVGKGGKDGSAAADFTDPTYTASAPVSTTVLAPLATNLQDLFDQTTIATLGGAIDAAAKETDDREAKVKAAVGQTIAFAKELEARAQTTLAELKGTHEAAAKIAAERDELATKFAQADKAATELDAQLKKLRADAGAVIKGHEESIRTLQEELARIDGDARTALAQRDTKITELDGQLQDLRAEAQAKLDELSRKLQEESDALAAAKRKAAAELDALQQQHDLVAADRNAARTELAEKASEYTTLETQYKELETRAQQILAERNAFETERNGFEADLQKAQARVLELEAKVTTLESGTTGADGGTSPLAQAKEELRQAQEAHIRLGQEKDLLQQAYDALETELETERKALLDASTRIAELDDEKAELKRQQAEEIDKVKALGVTLADGTAGTPAEDLDGVTAALTAVHQELKAALNDDDATISGAVGALSDKALSLEGIEELFARTQLDATHADYLDAAAFLAEVAKEFTPA